MERYLIAIDCDGTLVGRSLRLGDLTVDVIASLSALGHQVVLSSGRPWRSLEPYYRELRLSSPVITYNGAHAFFPRSMGPSFLSCFPTEVVNEAARLLSPHVDSLFVDDGEERYLLAEDPYIDTYFPYSGRPHRVSSPFPTVKRPSFVLLFKRKETVDEPYRSIVESFPSMAYRPWRDSPYAEAYRPEADKGKALLFLQKELGFDEAHTVAIGDSDNDLPMLKAAAYPYRMKDSTQLSLAPFPATEFASEEEGVARLLLSLPFLWK